jgi:3'-phosphoadenosine 5'-phosphosulfate sulfotransferase (PAPS reductase)/FAD synthetase
MLPYIISSSYGNDSIALIQLCHERQCEDVTIVFHDTGWARASWMDRVEAGERWAQSLGFKTDRTSSIGMAALVKQKKAWPRQGMQFCTEQLKIEPAMTWLDRNDPQRRAMCLIGVRRAESANRASFPEMVLNSANHGGRTVFAPMVNYTDEQRNVMVRRAGFEVLPHRSMECTPCINSNKADLRTLTEDEITAIERLENEMGFTGKGKPRTMFRPYRHMGATGIRAVVQWAHSDRGKYDPTEGAGNCDTGFCG